MFIHGLLLGFASRRRRRKIQGVEPSTPGCRASTIVYMHP